MFNQKLVHLYTKVLNFLKLKFSKLHHIDKLEGERVLVLSPHPDDDVFGCGGTMLLHKEANHEVRIVYMTDGRLGMKNKSQAETILIRKNEAIAALSLLKINEHDIYFLNQPDGSLSVSDTVCDALKRIIDDFKPNIIYLPSFLDQHADHITTNYILQKVCPLYNITIYGYEIWTPLIPNRLVDISSVIEVKKQAIDKHTSQLQELAYHKAIIGLNQYRGCMYAKKRMDYAEAFLCLDAKTYFELLTKDY